MANNVVKRERGRNKVNCISIFSIISLSFVFISCLPIIPPQVLIHHLYFSLVSWFSPLSWGLTIANHAGAMSEWLRCRSVLLLSTAKKGLDLTGSGLTFFMSLQSFSWELSPALALPTFQDQQLGQQTFCSTLARMASSGEESSIFTF